MGPYRLPTHRRGAHGNFFDDPFNFRNKILAFHELFWTLGTNWLYNIEHTVDFDFLIYVVFFILKAIQNISIIT